MDAKKSAVLKSVIWEQHFLCFYFDNMNEMLTIDFNYRQLQKNML